MYKHKALSLALICSLSLIGTTKNATLEDRVEKRFNIIMQEHGTIINSTQGHILLVQELIEKIIGSERKKTLSNTVGEALEDFLVNVITKIKQAEEAYLVKMAVVYKKLTHEKITKAEMKEMSSLYAKHLELFSDEIALLIKLLLPLKDIDTMTQEEIQAALTF